MPTPTSLHLKLRAGPRALTYKRVFRPLDSRRRLERRDGRRGSAASPRRTPLVLGMRASVGDSGRPPPRDTHYRHHIYRKDRAATRGTVLPSLRRRSSQRTFPTLFVVVRGVRPRQKHHHLYQPRLYILSGASGPGRRRSRASRARRRSPFSRFAPEARPRGPGAASGSRNRGGGP